MTKSKNKWGFLAPTRAKAEEMEKKYGVHFTPLIDYMKVIFPDIDDWEEEKEIDLSKNSKDNKSEYTKVDLYSSTKHKIVKIIVEGSVTFNTNTFETFFYQEKKINFTDFDVYCIDIGTQLTNATVKHIFGVDVKEPLFDENIPTLTQPWMNREFLSLIGSEQLFKKKYVGDEKQYQVNFDAYQSKYGVGISKIIVEKLFDLYSYEIDLSADKNISILIGPNGCGKTTILKIVRFMLSGNGSIKEIINIPFKSITCELTNGRKVKLKSFKNKINASVDNKKIAVFYKDEKAYNKDTKFYSLYEAHEEEIRKYYEDFRDVMDKLTSLTKNKKIISRNDFPDYMELINKWKKMKGQYQRGEHTTNFVISRIMFVVLLKKYDCYFDTEFISAQRLFRKVSNTKDNILEVHKYRDNVFVIKKDFKFFMRQAVFKYTREEIEKKINKDQMKMILFQKIINERFKITQKQLQYRVGEMYLTIGEGKDKKEIPFDVLSSGEKNDFIMFYNLIFTCENSKIFIDEPEISLHIDWQERYIDDLITICKMNNIQALVATHSPCIINEHTDLLAKWDVKK